ncbi:hypothetical protein [Roseisolibacter agri]|nr:hypothetical protein [Roseisolibacter agri]
MPAPFRCRAAWAALALGLAAWSRPVHAQGPGPKTATNVVSTVVGGVFAHTASPLTQNAQAGNLCSPGFCYTGSVTARGNRGWQLQVRLASDPGTFYVNYVQTSVPPSAQAVNSGVQTRLGTDSWLTVATGTDATAGAPIGVQLNANKVSGKNGIVPTPAQLAGVLAWQVVAYP